MPDDDPFAGRCGAEGPPITPLTAPASEKVVTIRCHLRPGHDGSHQGLVRLDWVDPEGDDDDW